MPPTTLSQTIKKKQTIMKKFGNLTRLFSTTKPEPYDKATRYVCFDIQPDTQNVNNTQEGDGTSAASDNAPQEGFSFLRVQIDPLIDYSHIKSQLVEAAYPQKDEHAFALNAIEYFLTDEDERDEDAIDEFKNFAAYRHLCATAAHKVMEYYQ